MIIKSLNYWSAPGGLEGTLDPIAFLDLAKKYRYPAVELAVGDSGAFPVTADQAFCAKVRAHADAIGVQIPSLASGLYWSRALGDADPAARAQAIDDLKRMVQIAAWLGAKTLLTIPGAVDVFFLPDRAAQSYDSVLANATAGLKEVLPVAESCEVRLGLENVWNKFLLSPTELASFIDSFGSPSLGAYLDVANVLPFGYPEQWIRILGKRLVGVHFKDFRRAVGTAEGFVDLLEGDVNWPEVMAALREVGYSGPVPAEMIPLYKHCPEVRIANASTAMDAILAL